MVEVHFKNGVFGVDNLGGEGKESFFYFPLKGSFGGEKGVFDKLLSNGGAALETAAEKSVIKSEADTWKSKAGMVIKIFVFAGNSGLFEVLGEFGEFNRGAFFVGINFVKKAALTVKDPGRNGKGRRRAKLGRQRKVFEDKPIENKEESGEGKKQEAAGAEPVRQAVFISFFHARPL